MHSILFICHGNICRSPLAEFTLKALVRRLRLEDAFTIASAATSQEEIGNPIYPPVRAILDEMQTDYTQKRARQLSLRDVREFELLIAMERYNLENLSYLHLPFKDGQLHLLRDFTKTPGDIADPWYTRDFELAYQQILEGCCGLLASFRTQDLPGLKLEELQEAALNLRVKHN